MLLDIYKELRVIMDDYVTGPGGVIYIAQVMSWDDSCHVMGGRNYAE